jgi:hypothetical protein
MRVWNEIGTGTVDSDYTGWSFEDLRALGEGEHEVTPRK